MSTGLKRKRPGRPKLYYARLTKNLSCREIAAMLGVSHETYLNIEQGRTKKIDILLAQKLCQILGLTMEELLEERTAVQ